ncbi:MAG: helix-turn-helix domain-containing protein [Clostridia bacterium]|nr:helix-turn-helix domain-containing protein [Clostridia bacterium]
MMRMFAEIKRDTDAVFPFVLTTVGDNDHQDPMLRPEGFNSHHFLWLKTGKGSFRFGEDRFELSAGEGVFIRAGVPHSYEGKNFATAWCTFLMSDAMLDHLGVGDYMRFRVPADLNREHEQLYRFSVGDSTILSRSTAGYTFVMELFDAILTPTVHLSERVNRLLERRYAEPLTLDLIAEEVGVDRFALCRCYKRERGGTVMEELNRIRIAKAKRFLKYSTASVESVGRMCGFESSSYFGKRFREAVGCTPAEYRK